MLMVNRFIPDRISVGSRTSSTSSGMLTKNYPKMVLNPTDLLDQILVHCPNTKFCNQILPKCDLESHIMEWCPGILCHCSNHHLGCDFLGPRFEMIIHKEDCHFKTGTESMTYKTVDKNDIEISDNVTFPNSSEYSTKYNSVSGDFPKINEGHITVIEIEHDPQEDLGISIVGGIDTPLRNIYVQDIIKNTAASKDGRLHSGDQILEINQCNLFFMRHNQAVEIFQSHLKNSCSVILSIFREGNNTRSKTITTHLRKGSHNIIGLKMGGIENHDGVFILDIIDNSEAHINGKLKKNDRMKQINDIIVGEKSQEEVSLIINNSIGPIKIVVTRNYSTDVEMRNVWSSNINDLKPNLIYRNLDNNFTKRQSPVIREKLVSITKKIGQYLGLTIAGGLGFNGRDTPIYIANIAEHSVLRNCLAVEKGDIILSVNNIDLLGIRHAEAVSSLKFVCDKFEKVDIRLLKSSELSPDLGTSDFQPTWIYWLGLPNYCQFPKSFYITKDEKNSTIGFSIVGGFEYQGTDLKQASPGSGPIGVICQSKMYDNYEQLVVVKSIVPNSPADKCGQLRCGDIVLTVDDCSVNHISHEEIVTILRKPHKKVKLKVLSSPGSIV